MFLEALAIAAISAVYVRGLSMAATMFRCHADGRDVTGCAGPSSAAVANAAIGLVWVLSISIVMAVSHGAWRRCCAIRSSPAIVADTFAAINTVHVSRRAMTGAMECGLACGRSVATFAGPFTLAIPCLHADAVTTIRLIIIFSCAVATAIAICITRWWDGTHLTGPAF